MADFGIESSGVGIEPPEVELQMKILIENYTKLSYKRTGLSSDYETRTNIAIAKLLALINNIKTQLESELITAPPTFSSTSTLGSMNQPKLQIPTFTGGHADWVTLEDLCQAAVGSRGLSLDSERLN